jgi:hypothetical protein
VGVKGVSGSRTSVLRAAGEIRAASAHNQWRLAVVTRALAALAVAEFGREEAVKAAGPYRADLARV